MPRNFVLTEEQVLGLPLDVLGIEIVRDVISNGEWNSYNWMNSAHSGRAYSKQALNALGEAWEWLHANGLISIDRTKNQTNCIFVTRLGHQVATEGSAERLRATARLSLDLHPLLEGKVRPQFLMGDYETAAFAAMKAVEVRVRDMGRFPDSDIGVKLMRKAFDPGGPLVEISLDSGEQEARRELFSGAIGTIKNPTSHREVRYDDPTEASEAILLADLLMRILDRIGGSDGAND